MTSTKSQPRVVVCTATADDSAICGKICYEAFSKVSSAHGFPCDLPGAEAAAGLLSMMFSHPGFSCVVAEADGRVVGSSKCLDERSVIAGIGPITVDHGIQNLGTGRMLMRAVLDRVKAILPERLAKWIEELECCHHLAGSAGGASM